MNATPKLIAKKNLRRGFFIKQQMCYGTTGAGAVILIEIAL